VGDVAADAGGAGVIPELLGCGEVSGGGRERGAHPRRTRAPKSTRRVVVRGRGGPNSQFSPSVWSLLTAAPTMSAVDGHRVSWVGRLSNVGIQRWSDHSPARGALGACAAQPCARETSAMGGATPGHVLEKKKGAIGFPARERQQGALQEVYNAPPPPGHGPPRRQRRAPRVRHGFKWGGSDALHALPSLPILSQPQHVQTGVGNRLMGRAPIQILFWSPLKMPGVEVVPAIVRLGDRVRRPQGRR
jgi:hypothetical protein